MYNVKISWQPTDAVYGESIGFVIMTTRQGEVPFQCFGSNIAQATTTCNACLSLTTDRRPFLPPKVVKKILELEFVEMSEISNNDKLPQVPGHPLAPALPQCKIYLNGLNSSRSWSCGHIKQQIRAEQNYKGNSGSRTTTNSDGKHWWRKT